MMSTMSKRGKDNVAWQWGRNKMTTEQQTAMSQESRDLGMKGGSSFNFYKLVPIEYDEIEGNIVK